MINTSGRQEYLTRMFARLVAICGLCIGAIWSFEAVARPAPPAWWLVSGHILLLIILAVIAVWASRARLQVLRALMAFSTVFGFSLQLLTYPAAPVPVSSYFWEISWLLTGIYLSFIALLFKTNRPYLTINLIAAVTATFPALSFWATYGSWPFQFWVITLAQFANVGYPTLLLELRSRMTLYGARQDRWRRRVAESAALREKLREERRLGTLLHDNILGVMSQIMWSGGEITDDLRTSVRGALTLLHDAERPGENEISAQEIRTIIETALRETDPGMDCSISATQGSLPEYVVATLMAALVEALRNSAKHAPGSHRSIRAELSGSSIRIVASDDGPGFTVGSVNPDRLGVSRSISGRMRDLAGGSAEINSAPGAGTVVILEWDRQ